MIFKKKNLKFGRYPSCDNINIAMRLLMNQDDLKNRNGVTECLGELTEAIFNADGYFYRDVAKDLINYNITVPLSMVNGVTVKDLKDL